MHRKNAGKKAIKAPKLPVQDTLDVWDQTELYHKTYYAQYSMNDSNLAGQEEKNLSFDQILFQKVRLDDTQLARVQIVDSRMTACDLANANWSEANLSRVELLGCHLTGFRSMEATFQDVLFKDCGGNFTQFAQSKFKSVRFEECDLSDVNFMDADLTGASFVKCTLQHADFTGAKLAGVDLRDSNLDGARIGPQELKGAIIDPEQALALVRSMGVIVKAREEE